MQHIHLETCHSTQKYLMEMTKAKAKANDAAVQDILISCEEQTEGVGQRSNTWDCYANTLCFSFTAKENEVLTLSALEIGVLVCEYFNKNFDTELKLKWPNDILNSRGEKVGGIIINKAGNSKLVIGIGLNICPYKSESLARYEVPAGFILDEEINFTKKAMASNIFNMITNNRLTSDQTINSWKALCSHIDQTVTLIDKTEDKELNGKFVGIGKYGQALIQNDNEGPTSEFYTGTLRIHN